MFKTLLRNKKAQNTAEYALLIALVVAGVIAMQTYAQRALQARVRDAAVTLQAKTTELGSSVQYEPYYLKSNYIVDRSSTENKVYGTTTDKVGNANAQVAMNMDTDRGRAGEQTSAYDDTTKLGTGSMPSGI